MDGDKNYQDLIKEYQILLENEKRRLNFVTENNDNAAEKEEDQIVLAATESDVQIDKCHEFDMDNGSAEISSQNVGIMHDHSEEMKDDKQRRVSGL